MAGFHSSILLLALVVAPLSTYAQHRGYGGGAPGGYIPPPDSTVAEVSTTLAVSIALADSTAPAQYAPYDGNYPSHRSSNTPTTPIESSQASIEPETTGGSNPSPVESNPNPTQPVTSAVPSSGGGGGGGGGGGSCTGSGMEIEWSGDAVSYSWSGGSGKTTGCLSLGSNFEGQVAIGGSGGTIFEGNPSGYFDVSFILGWSVPMVCSNGGAKTGCSIDLSSEHSCPDQQGSICKNPTGPGGSHDPGSYSGCASCTPWCYACSSPDPFFQPCSGAAYTYPYDDGATVGPASGAIQCCIGTGCGSTGREGSTAGGHAEPTRNPPCELCSGGGKRSVEEELDEVFKRAEKEMPAMSPSLLPRRHKRSSHRHAAVRGLKTLV